MRLVVKQARHSWQELLSPPAQWALSRHLHRDKREGDGAGAGKLAELGFLWQLKFGLYSGDGHTTL